jgi:hypothetical protein
MYCFFNLTTGTNIGGKYTAIIGLKKDLYEKDKLEVKQ